jgi:hypothetical protein
MNALAAARRRLPFAVPANPILNVALLKPEPCA